MGVADNLETQGALNKLAGTAGLAEAAAANKILNDAVALGAGVDGDQLTFINGAWTRTASGRPPVGTYTQLYPSYISAVLSPGPTNKDQMLYWPASLPGGGFTVSEVRMRVAGAAAATAVWRLGFYAASPTDGLPGSLIADLGTVDPTSSGIKAFTGLSVTLPSGPFWVAMGRQVLNGSTAGSYFTGVPNTRMTYGATGLNWIGGTCVYRNNAATGALPATAGSMNDGDGTMYPPQLELKRSA